jgi:hypothetical protein
MRVNFQGEVLKYESSPIFQKYYEKGIVPGFSISLSLLRRAKNKGVKAIQILTESGESYITSLSLLYRNGRPAFGDSGFCIFLPVECWNKVSEAENLRLFQEA